MPYGDITNARKVAAKMGNLTANLLYQGLERGVVFTRDNKLTFGINLNLVSAARATPDVRTATRDRIMRAIEGALPVGAIVRVYRENRPATKSSLREAAAPPPEGTDPLTRMLQANYDLFERMRRNNWISDSQTYLTVTLPIPGRPPRTPYNEESAAPHVEKALTLQSRLVRQLSVAGLQAGPMETKDSWGRIMDFFNPDMASAEKPIYQPNLDMGDAAAAKVGRRLKNNPRAPRPYVSTMRSQVACSDIDLDHDACFTVGHSRVGIVSFLKPARGTQIGASDQILQALGGTHSTFVVEYLVVDSAKIRAQVNDSLDKQETAANDPSMKAGREIMTRIARGHHLVQDLESGQVLTEMSMHAVIFAREQEVLDDRRERVLAAFSSVGGSMPRIANAGAAIHLYLELAPFSGQRSTYQVPAYYRNAVDCIPQISPWRGSPEGVLPLRGRGGNIFSVGPVGLSNAGTVVAAKSGGGKSVLVSMLASSLKAFYNASLTVVDPKRDYTAVFMALNAMKSIITFAPGATLPTGERVVYNPFDLPAEEVNLTAEKLAFLLELFHALGLHDHSPGQTNILTEAIRMFYYRFSVPVGETMVYQEAYLSDFQTVLANLNTVGDQSVQSDPELRRAVREMANSLLAYCGETPIGTLLDGPTSIDITSRYLYLDVSGVMKHKLLSKVAAIVSQELVWNRAMTLEGKNVIVMEEAGVVQEVPGIVELVNRIFKTGRSLGIIPILVVQNIADAVFYKSVINNAATKLLLAAEPSERAEIAALFDLNAAMQGLHASLGGEDGRYRDVLVVQSGLGGMDGEVGQLWLSREAYWMSTSVDTEAALRKRVADEQFDGNEALAALAIAQEEHHAPQLRIRAA